jgi:hypothetical protein
MEATREVVVVRREEKYDAILGNATCGRVIPRFVTITVLIYLFCC